MPFYSHNGALPSLRNFTQPNLNSGWALAVSVLASFLLLRRWQWFKWPGPVTVNDNNQTNRSLPSGPLCIVIAGDTFPPNVNGAATFTVQLALGLIKRGHKIHVVVPSSNDQYGTFNEEHHGVIITVHRLRSVCWPWLPSFRCALPWEVRRATGHILDTVNPHAVHIQSPFQVGRGIAREAHQRGLRIIATHHMMSENLSEHVPLAATLVPLVLKMMWIDIASTYNLVDVLTTPTQLAASYLRRNISLQAPQYISAISCGIDGSQYASCHLRPNRNEIVFVGRIAPEKQLGVLLRAFSRLPSRLGATIRIIGGEEGEKQPLLWQLKALAAELGIDDRVVFTGHVPEEEKQVALTNATVFAMPSTAELQSISTLEAMASGLPIVAARAMALPHLVNGNGHLFETGDDEDLANKLLMVLTSEGAAYLKMKLASKKLVEGHDIKHTLDAFEALYRGERAPRA